jgi:hypothetical protein
MVGEAILPSLLHQDPRYFYNGKWEPNYPSVGGDFAAGAISNSDYPQSNRGAGILFQNALITTGGRMANGLVQEFVLRRLTPNARNRSQ